MTYDGSAGKAIILNILSNYNSPTSVICIKQQMSIDILF